MNNCQNCPVNDGYKPAEAVHEIAEPKTQQPEALRLAEHLENFRSFNDDLAAARELRRQHARIAELEERLEIDCRHPYDGIAARDVTIKALDERIAELEASQARVPLSDDVLRDAARYRFLAGHCRSTSEHWGGRWSIVVDGPAPKSHDSEDDFDAAIDAAQAKQGGA